MYHCFKKSNSLKEFCEDIKTSDENLLSCYKQLQEGSNIIPEDIKKLESKIACKTDSTNADQYYECLKRSKDTLDFCYDQYMIEFPPSSSPED